jgi:predicted ABC-type ATPase
LPFARKTNPPPRVVIFAGRNGAGKSTHADAILAALGIETFVNADCIARGLSGRNTDTVAFEAGCVMLKRLHQLADEWTLFDNSTSPQALPVATQFANQLTVTETATWQKLQKLSKVV